MTYAQLEDRLKPRLHNKLGAIPSRRAFINSSIRELNDIVDLRGTKRRQGSPVGLFEDVFQVPAPTDLKGQALIDVAPLRDRSSFKNWTLTTPEEFDRRKNLGDYLVSVFSDSQYRKLLINKASESTKVIIHEMDDDSDTVTGIWTAADGASNLEIDDWNYLFGSGCLRFDTAEGAADTTATLTNTTITLVDISGIVDEAFLFFGLYIPSAAAATALGSVQFDGGDDTSNYWTKSLTTNYGGGAFRLGWNIIAFEIASATKTGSPTGADFTYAKITLTKNATLAATTGWRVDQISAIRGGLHLIDYYSKYYWKSAAGVYLENSTVDTDVLLVDEDEESLALNKVAYDASQVLRELRDDTNFKERFDDSLDIHRKNYPSERKRLITNYYDFQN